MLMVSMFSYCLDPGMTWSLMVTVISDTSEESVVHDNFMYICVLMRMTVVSLVLDGLA